MKKQKIIALGVVLAGATAASAMCPLPDGTECAELDIVVRDFLSTHPDFENFTEEAHNSIHNGGTCNGSACVGTYPATWGHTGFADDPNWTVKRTDENTWGCGNTQQPLLGVPMGTEGYPMAVATGLGYPSVLPSYLQAVTGAIPQGYVWYGEFQGCQMDPKLNPKGLKVMRGYAHELCNDVSVTNTWNPGMKDDQKKCASKICSQHSWTQIVYVTPGMVSPYLRFTDKNMDGELDLLEEVDIDKLRDACDNQYFVQWYSDDPTGTVSLRTNTTLQLPKVAGQENLYEIDYNWNNGGYFPLDEVDPTTMAWLAPKVGTEYTQFGPQSLSIFCPPYKYQWASTQTDYNGDKTNDLCSAWLAAGGPKVGGSPTAAAALGYVGSAAYQAAASKGALGLRHLRNYSLTMMGFLSFKYHKGAKEVFEFAGDDDMWIFVDGVLAVDLGGTHLAAPGKADMDYLASQGHGCHAGEPLLDSCQFKLDVDGTWADGSWHHLHFFYADRQTDGSNMRIKSTLSELAPSRYGQPTVSDVMVTVSKDADGNAVTITSMFLTTPLKAETINNLNAGTTQPAILVQRTVYNAAGDSIGVGTYGYVVSSITGGEKKGADGYQYNIQGYMIDSTGAKVESGVLSGDAIAFNFPYNPDYEDDGYSFWHKQLLFQITSEGGKDVAGLPDEWGIVSFRVDIEPETYPQDNTITRPDFDQKAQELTNLAGGDDLPFNATGEIFVTPIPVVPGVDPINGLTEDNRKDYSAAPSAGASTQSGTVVVRNDNKSSTDPRCFSEGGVESCISYGFATMTPYKVNIRVFDHLGHFVSQYTQEMSKDEFEKALDGGKAPTQTCTDGTPLHGSGAMWVSVKLYPVSQTGRKLATGPYVYQVSIINEAYKPCYMLYGNSPSIMTQPYMRTYEVHTRGYRRVQK